ncbi:unnamed protein product, partial [Plutella xylostella]
EFLNTINIEITCGIFKSFPDSCEVLACHKTRMAKWSWGVLSKLLQLHNLVRLSIGLSTLAFFLNFGQLQL